MMHPAIALMLFYVLLAVAVVVLRGDFIDWPRGVDRVLAFGICLGAVALLLRSWKARQPESGPADDGSSRPRSTWIWWAGIAGLAAVVFLAALPPVSELLARPWQVERPDEGRDSPSPEPLPPSPDAVPHQLDPDDSGDETGPGHGLDRAVGEAETKSLLERMRDAIRTRPPWLFALLLLLALVAAAWMAWWVRRTLKGGRGRANPGEPLPPWHDDPAAPAYVREFRRLCEHLGHAPRPGDTWRDLLARLQVGNGPAALVSAEPLEPVAVYHYRVRYEGAEEDSAAERAYVRIIREARKASIVSPATEKEPAA